MRKLVNYLLMIYTRAAGVLLLQGDTRKRRLFDQTDFFFQCEDVCILWNSYRRFLLPVVVEITFTCLEVSVSVPDEDSIYSALKG